MPVKTCSFCSYYIKDRGYRALYSPASLEQYKYAFSRLKFFPTGKSYACNLCTNKLNRISNIDQSIRTRVEQLKEEREKLLGYVEILTVDIYVKVFTVLCHEPFSNPRFLCLINSVG